MVGARILVAACVSAALGVAAPSSAQQPPQSQSVQPARQAGPRVMPSSRATVEVVLDRKLADGRWVAAPGMTGARIRIDYGQPHARGRDVIGGVVPFDSVWRTGANAPTTLTTDVDLTIGGTAIPAGSYTLLTLPRRDGWQLIVSRQMGRPASEYDQSQDLARIPLRMRTLDGPVESLSISLIPTLVPEGSTDMPSGVLRLAWGRTELTTDWRVAAR
jgi:hypothetical protein